jgi:tRNA pseudouridine38-40 synthase
VPRYKLTIEYDGTAFSGWQVQPNAPSIQEAVQTALGVILGEAAPVTGSGRTDAGVHARQQIAHFDAPELDPHRLIGALNGLLPPGIAVVQLDPARSDFHARYDAVERVYRYLVSTRHCALERHFRVVIPAGTDFEAMNRAAAVLVGTRDFSAFCRTQSATQNRICAVVRALWMREDHPGYLAFEIAADRFLHGMVRSIVGTLLQIGRRNRPESDIERILQSRDRREAGPAAPARGLVLERVEYR